MKRFVLILVTILAAPPAFAVSIDDYLAAGYVVVNRTQLAGAFTGCDIDRHLLMQDGSMFVCTQKRAQLGFQPQVTILAAPAGPPSVLLIGGQPYRGVLAKLGDRVYAPPLQITSGPPPEPAPGTQTDRVRGIEPVRSIGWDMASLHKPLNAAQADELPKDKRGLPPPAPRAPVPQRAPM